MSWEQLKGDETPRWVRKHAAKRRGNDPHVVGQSEIVHGDTFVYKIEYKHKNHGRERDFYKQLKSEYFETTSDEGTCPNCQEYVRRYEDDTYLTCHRCGWQYKPASERIKNLFR